MWNLQKRIKSKKIKQAKMAIIEAKLMVDFYEYLKSVSEEEDAEKAKIDLKIASMRDAIDFNQAFINHFK